MKKFVGKRIPKGLNFNSPEFHSGENKAGLRLNAGGVQPNDANLPLVKPASIHILKPFGLISNSRYIIE
ncbi:hypothetical protein [Parafilimonas sp.]|uniref:hypothetical protein n=1 Tax=Parafilimonas sp. TaxID=1969739 RepID=UPI0039E40C3A